MGQRSAAVQVLVGSALSWGQLCGGSHEILWRMLAAMQAS